MQQAEVIRDPIKHESEETNLDMMALIASFGGGMVGAYMGALPAFIMTGILALCGAIATAAGASTDIAVGFLAFGSLLGPHIAFAGGVAAAAYAAKKGKIASGTDILACLNGTGAPDVLLVGGAFGVLGFLICYGISITPLGPLTDLPGITVVISGIIARLAFGNTGVTGKFTGEGKRAWMPDSAATMYNVVLGAGIGIAVSYVAASLAMAGVSEGTLGIFPIICFGISAFTLIFTQTGFAMPASHHITLPASSAAVLGITAYGPSGAALGVLFGILGSVVGGIAASTFNSHCDTHIDPPATTIFTLTIVISLIRMSIM